ncbi:PREDICTED: uncharacterized protein LOC105974545 [Erythranthe guttata]|uniref:uncharacterized protein LOC105974545 n=1 Tax=Erythranthe guttata TaxID=4155 RepID=UPI00064E0D76|nr:PREDICTED: uncharacterized protein LOC105974545 [Erythranthe guttata]|eukprot:XP_012855111.1 PREDICTED: uncharacterized protein LOC105974545 [Erythranthe guttata]
MKNVTFVNDKAARKHIEMENLRNESIEDREGLTSEREIVKKVLGQRSGYEKGMGYGFVPSKCTKRSTCESSQLEALKEKLSGTEDELRNVVSCINSQKEMILNQEAIIQNYDDRCKKQDEEMSSLKEGQNELKKMLLLFMQQNTSSNP